MKNVAILLSGRGSNFLALSDAIEAGEIPAQIVLVVSNHADATGLEHARNRNYETVCIPSAGVERETYDRQVVAKLQAADTQVICLAGFMRLLSPWFIRQFPHRILNIHPSLLPAFTGLHGQRQALDWGVKVGGCTVHLVDEEYDRGPIVAQRKVPVLVDDTPDSLARRVLEQEHAIYPETLQMIASGEIDLDRLPVQDAGRPLPQVAP
ncbi:MAG: phosphoribosylglycinamide formyltransferase [Acidobacteria bacterium]|nr:phosphoribosylglycinamide formyltransferase [Acidobacteriota bacterium]